MCVMEEKVLIEVGRYVKFDRVCEGIFKDTILLKIMYYC